MIGWTAFSAGFGALLSRLSGLPSVDPTDDGLGFTFPGDATCATMSFAFRSSTPLGRDELRRDWDPDAVIDGDTSGPDGDPALGGVVYSANGNREIILLVTCESHLQTTPAWPYIERVRDYLSLPSAHAELVALGVAYQKSGQIHDLSREQDGRMVSRYVLEIWLNTMSNAVDLPITTIESAPVDTSEIT